MNTGAPAASPAGHRCMASQGRTPPPPQPLNPPTTLFIYCSQALFTRHPRPPTPSQCPHVNTATGEGEETRARYDRDVIQSSVGAGLFVPSSPPSLAVYSVPRVGGIIIQEEISAAYLSSWGLPGSFAKPAPQSVIFF